MKESKWKKFKRNDIEKIPTWDEFLFAILGMFVFSVFKSYDVAFIVLVLIWYWSKIRYYEKKIMEKEKDIYNVYYDNCGPIPLSVIEGKTKMDRKPMEYELKQLENKRRFLVDKFVIINLILVVLIELFIKK